MSQRVFLLRDAQKAMSDTIKGNVRRNKPNVRCNKVNVRCNKPSVRCNKVNVRRNKPNVRLSYFPVVRNNSQVAYSPEKIKIYLNKFTFD